jgi:hypothetical protein
MSRRAVLPMTSADDRLLQFQKKGMGIGMPQHREQATWSVTDWKGKMLVDRNGEKLGKLQDVFVDVQGTGSVCPEIERHGQELSQVEESTRYHDFELNYTPISTESRRCA